MNGGGVESTDSELWKRNGAVLDREGQYKDKHYVCVQCG